MSAADEARAVAARRTSSRAPAAAGLAAMVAVETGVALARERRDAFSSFFLLLIDLDGCGLGVGCGSDL
jgi:hypothetical protein